jgi:hypothetical protein
MANIVNPSFSLPQKFVGSLGVFLFPTANGYSCVKGIRKGLSHTTAHSPLITYLFPTPELNPVNCWNCDIKKEKAEFTLTEFW